MTTGERIKRKRDEAGMTQEQLGAAIQSTKQTIYKYENGIVTNIPMDKIEKMARVLKTTPSFLLGWDETVSAIEKLATGPLDDEKKKSVKEALRILDPRASAADSDEIGAIAAHHEGEDWTPEELEEIEQFKAFVRSKRQNKE